MTHMWGKPSHGVSVRVLSQRSSTSPVPIDAGHRIASGITETNYTDCGNVNNRYYAVTAVNENGESDPSDEDRASEPCGSALAMTLTESGGEPVVTKYYFHGGKRVAMDRDGVVQYLVGDHLGSTSLVLNANGTVHSEARHYPYGEERWSSGTLPTDYRFTGQRQDSGLGLIHMGARFYDAYINRFISPDSIIPQPGNPQSFNRYSYCLNNPLRFIDPSGHDPLDAAWQEEFWSLHGRDPTWEDILIRLFSIAFPDEWDWSAFYHDDGTYIPGSLETMLRESVLQGANNRSWADVPESLDRLAGWYNDGEERLFARDIGTLFGGLQDRLQEPSAWRAITFSDNPAHVWAYVREEGIEPFMLGVDPDANIHHWAWGLAMGAEYGPGGSTLNMGREVALHVAALRNGNANWGNTWADMWMGNVGASLGWSLRLLGIRNIRTAWSIHMMEWLP